MEAHGGQGDAEDRCREMQGGAWRCMGMEVHHERFAGGVHARAHLIKVRQLVLVEIVRPPVDVRLVSSGPFPYHILLGKPAQRVGGELGAVAH